MQHHCKKLFLVVIMTICSYFWSDNTAQAQDQLSTFSSGSTPIQQVNLSAPYMENSVLADPSTLTTGSHTYNYVAVKFQALASGSYSFGISNEAQDSVMILYQGNFNPGSPGTGALIGNDDTPKSTIETMTNGEVSAASLVCVGSGGSACPALQNVSMTVGQTYTMFISTWSPSDSLATPVSFFCYGPGACGTASSLGLPPTPSITAPATATGPYSITVTFDNDVTGFELADITVGNGTASNFQAVSTVQYTATITPTAAGNVTVDINAGVAQDGSSQDNNAAPQAVTNYIPSDSVKPTVSITAPASSLYIPGRTTGSYGITVTFSEDVTGFELSDLTLENGTASNFQAVSAAQYTATITPIADGDVTVDIAADVAHDAANNGNTAAPQAVTRTGVNSPYVETRTKRVVQNMMVQRGNQIVSNAPDLVRLFNRGNEGGFAGPFGFTATGDLSNLQLGFSTSLRQIVHSAKAKAAAERRGILQALEPADQALLADDWQKDGFDVWVKGKIVGVDSDISHSDMSLVYIGADYRFNSSLMLGVIGQLDWIDEENKSESISTNGNGWMLGPYVVARLSDNLLFDGQISYGRSDNQVDALGIGTKDGFDGERWLIKGQLTGVFEHEGFNISPEIGISYFQEDQQAFSNSLGISIGSQTVSLGQMSFGPMFSRAIKVDDAMTITPFTSIKGIWDFKKTDMVDINNGYTTNSEDLRGRVEGGLSIISSDGVSVTGEGFYDGIGVDGFDAYGGSITARFLLN